MDFLIGFIGGLTLGVVGMAIWFVSMLDDLRGELDYYQREAKHYKEELEHDISNGEIALKFAADYINKHNL